MKIKIAIIALFLCFMLKATSQKYDIRHFNPETGLNGTYVYTTMQGPKGYKWIGTDYGLMRFDGLKFELMDANDSTKKNFTTTAFIDDNNRIYFGYFNGKIKLFNGVEFEIVYDAVYEQSPVTAIVKCQNNLVAVTQNQGLIRVMKDTVEYLRPNQLKFKKTNFARVFKDLILIGTNEGLLAFRFNDNDDLVYAGSVEDLNFMAIQIIEQNKVADNSFWVGTDYGIYHLDLSIEGDRISGQVEKVAFLEKQSIIAMKESSNLDLWVGTKFKGLVKVNFNTDNTKSIQFTHLDKDHSFPSNLISTINMDEDESIWAGTIGDGLIQVYKKGLLFYNFEEFRARSVNGISGNSKHEFYFATDVGIIRGFYAGEIDSLNFELITHETSEGNNVTAIYVDDKDRIYYSVEDLGIYTADSEWKNIEKIDFNSGGGKLLARQITKDPKGNLWLSLTQKGVFVIDTLGKVAKTYSTSSGFYHNEIYHIHFDKKGNTWFASHGAGLAVERSDGKILYLTKDGAFPSHDVNDISEDEFGNLWIGTHGDGIYEYNGEEFIRFSTKEGLLNDFCSAVISDKSNHVWATHRTGLSRVDEFTEAVSTIQKKDGLVVAEFIHNSIFTDQDHNIWIGNRNGVTFLSAPDKMFESKILKPIISDIKIGFNSINLFEYSSDSISGSRVPNNLEFPYDLNNPTFEFVAINLKNPEANLYQYRLIGLDENWSPITDNNQIPFNNLSPGQYTFQVRQSDNPNHWDDNISSVTFKVKPPWWGTWWAILLFVLAGVSLIYGFIKWRTDRLNKRLKEKQRLVSIAESQNKRLKEFSFITSHHTRSSASNIMGLIAAIEIDPTNKEFIYMLRKSSNRLNGTIRNINELLNFENDRENLNVEACRVSESIQRVISHHEELIKKQEADVKVEVASEFYVQAVPTYLDSALSNLVSNALNYGVTKDKKQVFIETYQQNNEIVISIKDDGLGIDLGKFYDKVFTLGARFHSSIEQGDGIGMFLSKNQVESMGGKIAIESKAGAGTTVKLYLKKTKPIALAK